VSSIFSTNPNIPGITSEPTFGDYDMVRMRLGLRDLPFRMSIHKLGGGKRIVLVSNDDTYVTIEDGSELFPSDALITRLRMLL
jgi:hypothetical protein